MDSTPGLPVANPTLTRAVCKAIVAGWEGISASEMYNAFAAAGIRMIEEGGSKTEVAYQTLMNEQEFGRSSDKLIGFITEALAPARFLDDPRKRQRIVSDVDVVLRIYGFSLDPQGRVVPAVSGATGATALTERLREKLVVRVAHTEALRFCEKELISESMFHAVTEATKSLMDRIRPEGFVLDGERLTQEVFGTRKNPGPRFINQMTSPSDEAAPFGFIQLLNGVYGHLRNDRSHRTRHSSEEDEQDFLDAMSMISYAPRVLDRSYVQEGS